MTITERLETIEATLDQLLTHLEQAAKNVDKIVAIQDNLINRIEALEHDREKASSPRVQ